MIISWSNTKFFKLTSQELYDRQEGQLLMALGVKGLIYFQTKQKKWRIKARWTVEVVAKIKLQIHFLRIRQTRKQNKGEQKTQTNVVQDPG